MGTLSVPFSSGQWLLHETVRRCRVRCPTLSVPFSSGQWLLLKRQFSCFYVPKLLSVPFSSGQWLLLQPSLMRTRQFIVFQSPFHRGNGCYISVMRGESRVDCPFSPLFIGAMVATLFDASRSSFAFDFQSPFHRGNGCYKDKNKLIICQPTDFQSPFHRGNGCYRPIIC